VHLDEIDFDLEKQIVMFWAMLEYLIGQFASGAGKKAGLYPQQVSSVLAQIVTAGKDQLKSVYITWFWFFVVACGQRSQERQCFFTVRR
jgi:type I restriction enzyme M protein